jgi:CO/xanthine dehydrogenase FAD-binding subunit
VAVGAASAVAQRLPLLETALVGQRCDANLGEHAMPEHLSALAPIDDVRASREYRLDAARTLVRRTLRELGARA